MFFPFDRMLKCYASFKSQLEKVFSDPQRWSLPLWFNSILSTYCYFHLCQSIVEFVLLLLSPLLWMAKGLQFKDSSITYLGDFGQITLLPSPDIFFCKRNTDITFPPPSGCCETSQRWPIWKHFINYKVLTNSRWNRGDVLSYVTDHTNREKDVTSHHLPKLLQPRLPMSKDFPNAKVEALFSTFILRNPLAALNTDDLAFLLLSSLGFHPAAAPSPSALLNPSFFSHS